MFKLLIAGDFLVTEEYKDQDLIDESVVELFEEANYRIVNLEAPLTPNQPENRILKTGPHLRSSADAILPYLNQVKIDMVTLANNHVLDYGEQGLKDTLALCAENSITTVGAGFDLEKAQKPQRIELEGKTISIINFAENEWASATTDSGGAHPMNVVDNSRLIKLEKEKADFVIVIIHGGHEYYELPSPRMVKQYRFYADQGADVIAGHHTHCIGGYKFYKGVPIFYNIGNFLFTRQSINKQWFEGLVLELKFNSELIETRLVPVLQDKEDFTLSLANGKTLENILDRIAHLSAIIQNENFLRSEWEKFIEKKKSSYLRYFSVSAFIGNRFVKAFFNKIDLTRLLTRKSSRRLFLNLLQCESHIDLSKEVLTRHINE